MHKTVRGKSAIDQSADNKSTRGKFSILLLENMYISLIREPRRGRIGLYERTRPGDERAEETQEHK